MRKLFDYPFTCPEIDLCLSDIDCAIDYAIDDIMNEDYENAETQFRIDIRRNIMEAISKSIEAVRSSNSNLRDEAEKKFIELMDDLSYAAEEIDDLKKRIEQLENVISDQDEDLEYYKEGYYRLEKENNELADELYEYKQ